MLRTSHLSLLQKHDSYDVILMTSTDDMRGVILSHSISHQWRGWGNGITSFYFDKWETNDNIPEYQAIGNNIIVECCMCTLLW